MQGESKVVKFNVLLKILHMLHRHDQKMPPKWKDFLARLG